MYMERGGGEEVLALVLHNSECIMKYTVKTNIYHYITITVLFQIFFTVFNTTHMITYMLITLVVCI